MLLGSADSKYLVACCWAGHKEPQQSPTGSRYATALTTMYTNHELGAISHVQSLTIVYILILC